LLPEATVLFVTVDLFGTEAAALVTWAVGAAATGFG